MLSPSRGRQRQNGQYVSRSLHLISLWSNRELLVVCLYGKPIGTLLLLRRIQGKQIYTWAKMEQLARGNWRTINGSNKTLQPEQGGENGAMTRSSPVEPWYIATVVHYPIIGRQSFSCIPSFDGVQGRIPRKDGAQIHTLHGAGASFCILHVTSAGRSMN